VSCARSRSPSTTASDSLPRNCPTRSTPSPIPSARSTSSVGINVSERVDDSLCCLRLSGRRAAADEAQKRAYKHGYRKLNFAFAARRSFIQRARAPECYARQRTRRSAAASTFFASSIDLALARTIHGDRKRWARARSQRRRRLCSARSRRMTCRSPHRHGSGGPGSPTSETRSSTSAVQSERR
jgi:hypothetical protein